MTVQEVLKSVGVFFKTIYTNFVESDEYEYVKQIVIGVGLAAILVGGYYGYRWYTASYEQSAHRLFAQDADEFERVGQEEGKKEDWESVAALFDRGYEEYSKSSLAPYFLMYKAEVMRKQGKTEEEVFTALERALSAMPASSPLVSTYKVKMALMQLDSKSEEQRKAGIDSLTKLAADTKSSGSDAAAYYLGLWYLTQNKAAQAKEVWEKLLDAYKDAKKLGESPWAMLAKEKVTQIVG